MSFTKNNSSDSKSWTPVKHRWPPLNSSHATTTQFDASFTEDEDIFVSSRGNNNTRMMIQPVEDYAFTANTELIPILAEGRREIHGKFKKQTAQIEDVTSVTDKLQSENKELQKEIEKNQSEIATMIVEQSQQRQQHQQELKLVKDELEVVKINHAKLRKTVIDLNAGLAQRGLEIETLNASLNTKCNQIMSVVRATSHNTTNFS